MKKVDVLGTTYTITQRSRDDPALDNASGYCDPTAKLIVVDDMKEDQGRPDAMADLKQYKKHITRHELIHAFLAESGLHECSWAANEEIVDWMAAQFPKMAEAFKAVGCI